MLKKNFRYVLIFFRYVLTGKIATSISKNVSPASSLSMKTMSKLLEDTCYEVTPPKVSLKSNVIYQNYVNIGYVSESKDMDILAKYASYR